MVNVASKFHLKLTIPSPFNFFRFWCFAESPQQFAPANGPGPCRVQAFDFPLSGFPVAPTVPNGARVASSRIPGSGSSFAIY